MPLLAQPQKRPQRLQMIEEAMKEKAPKTYRELQRSGQLKKVIEQREQEMMQSYDREWANKILGENPKGSTLQEATQSSTMTESRLWEETLGTFLEFRDPAEITA